MVISDSEPVIEVRDLEIRAPEEHPAKEQVYCSMLK